MTIPTSDTTTPIPPASQDDALLTPDIVRTSTSINEPPQPNEGNDGEKEPGPEPYDIEKCTLTFRVEIFPREAEGVSRLALLAVNSHGDEPFQPRLVAFEGDFTALVPHLNQLYAAFASAMPVREAAAAKRKAEERAKKEMEEAQRKARSAKSQSKSATPKNKHKRGHRVQLSDVPDDNGQGAPTPPATPAAPQPVPNAVVDAAPSVPAEPEKNPESEQFGLFQ